MKKFYIVWNEGRSEGFITDDEGDARYTLTGKKKYLAVPYASTTLGDEFRECYGDENLSIETVELPD